MGISKHIITKTPLSNLICWTFQNVRRRAAVKFNQMSDEKLQMSSEAQKYFAYTAILPFTLRNISYNDVHPVRHPRRVM